MQTASVPVIAISKGKEIGTSLAVAACRGDDRAMSWEDWRENSGFDEEVGSWLVSGACLAFSGLPSRLVAERPFTT